MIAPYVQESREVEEARSIHQKLVASRQAQEQNAIAEGLYLCKFHDLAGWQALGFSTFAAYCCAPLESGGAALSYSTACRKRRVAEHYCVELGIDPGRLVGAGYSKLDAVRDAATTETVDEVIANAEAMAEKDLKIHYGVISTPKVQRHECPSCGFEWADGEVEE